MKKNLVNEIEKIMREEENSLEEIMQELLKDDEIEVFYQKIKDKTVKNRHCSHLCVQCRLFSNGIETIDEEEIKTATDCSIALGQDFDYDSREYYITLYVGDATPEEVADFIMNNYNKVGF